MSLTHGKPLGVPLGTFGGVPVYVSPHATETRPRFPDKKRTKRRLRRVIGKYGSWYMRAPACLRFNGALIMHPKLADELKRRAREDSNV